MEKGEAGRVFISYRRQETAWPARQLYDLLIAELGADRVFKDIDNIEPGADFVERIQSAVGSCQVLLALIGPQWLTVTDASGGRRLDDPTDFVRLEVETALNRDDVRVIPILVDNARMPTPRELPTGLAALTHRQAVEINPVNFDTRRLLRVLNDTLNDVRREAAASSISGVGAEARPPETAPPVPPVESAGAAGTSDERPLWSESRVPVGQPSGSASEPTLLIAIGKAVRDVVTEGRVVFNPATNMRQGHSEPVEVAIARSTNLDQELLASLRSTTNARVETIATSPFMGVDLRGDGFDITALAEREQLLYQIARWEFDVFPRRSGTRRLQVCVTMRIPISNRSDETISVPVLERSVRVRVDPVYGSKQFLSKNWQWLVASAAGLAGVVTAWIKLFGGE
jgi:hypothetical protein